MRAWEEVERNGWSEDFLRERGGKEGREAVVEGADGCLLMESAGLCTIVWFGMRS